MDRKQFVVLRENLYEITKETVDKVNASNPDYVVRIEGKFMDLLDEVDAMGYQLGYLDEYNNYIESKKKTKVKKK